MAASCFGGWQLERPEGAPQGPHALPDGGLEAAAITKAMEAVWKGHAGALLMPIHDGILCRWELAEDVEQAMKAGYAAVCGVAPRVKRIGGSAPWDF